jgi:hypothetical protein
MQNQILIAILKCVLLRVLNIRKTAQSHCFSGFLMVEARGVAPLSSIAITPPSLASSATGGASFGFNSLHSNKKTRPWRAVLFGGGEGSRTTINKIFSVISSKYTLICTIKHTNSWDIFTL